MAATELSSLSKRLRAAVAVLLGAAAVNSDAVSAASPTKETPPPEPASRGQSWNWNSSFLHYSESDRISVSEPQIGVRRDFGNEQALTILATVDTISGATPLGTLPPTLATAPNSITGPSGRLVNPYVGKIPTSEMSDTRLALSGTYEQPLSPTMHGVFGGQVAKEHDFLSMGLNGTFHRDFNQKNTTLSFGLSPEVDIVSPNGGLPGEYATQLAPNEFDGTRRTKVVLGGLVGVTQVINKRTLMQLNYAPTYENGYLNDPYKLLSLYNTNGDPLTTIHERRPHTRLEHSLYWLLRYNMRAADVFGLGLRYFLDDWGIRSQMIDFTYRWQAQKRLYFQPHVRYSHQTAADFFRAGLPSGQALPEFASADYRLTDLDGVTIGLQIGWTFRNDSELILRAEYFTQTGESRPKDAVGAQRNYDLFPTLHASILQVEYDFDPKKLFGQKPTK